MGYTAAQIANIKTIIAEGKAMGEQPPEILTAIMVALTESSAQNYANSNSAASLALPHDAVGSDHGSVGVFQQQSGQVPGSTANWGSIADLMNPRIAAEKFYQAFDSKRSQMTGLSPAQDAQLVQQSAYADGSNYAANQAQAAALFNQYNGTSKSFLGTITGDIGGVVGGAGKVITAPADAAMSVTDALGKVSGAVTSTQFWIRVGFVVLGFVILIIGINELAKAGGDSTPIIDVTPPAPAPASPTPATSAPGPRSKGAGRGPGPVTRTAEHTAKKTKSVAAVAAE